MAAPDDIDNEMRLQLACALQTSLDVETLIAILGSHLQNPVPHQGLRFAYEPGAIDLSVGDPTGHCQTFPLALEQESLGELRIYCAEPLADSSKDAADALIAIALHPLRNALMYREAINASVRDPLTGVHNRSSLHQVLDREVEMSRRHGAPLSLIMLDVDRFKSINDRHGHLAGDMALKSIANCVRACIRDSDILFRYGGEEFCIALANTSLAGATKLAERVRRALEILVVRTSGARLHVTASLGVATLGAEDDAARLVAKADESLYRAKALGRNRIATQEDARTVLSRR